MSCSSHFNNNNNNNDTNNNNGDNNNYVHNFYGDMAPLSRQQMIENASNIRSFGAPHNFTFSYPTLGTTVPTPRPNIQATSSMPFLGPGLGTAWQHSNPCSVTTLVNSNLTPTIYTGMPNRSEPQPSCSSPMKRPKRKAQEYSEDAPSSKVYLCTDQFANLNLNNDWTQQEVKDHDPAGWGRFQEVENSIECDSDDDNMKKKQKEGVLHLNNAITDAISSQTSETILPWNVLNEIAKPCMQVVLWKSPGELVRDLVKEDSTSLSLNTLPSSPIPSAMQSLSSSATSPLKLPPTAFEDSSNFISTATNQQGSFPTTSSRVWPQQDISNKTTSPFHQYNSSSLHQVPIPSSTLPQREWNMLSSSSSLLSPSLSLSSKLNSSNIVTMSQDPSVWDDNLDLVGKYDEEMQL